MKVLTTSRIASCTLLALLLAATSGRAVADGRAPTSSAAPADQYFGAMKMSALGIRDRVDVLGRRYHARTITDDDLVHDAKLAESALDAWQHQYPRDPWIVPTAYHLEQLYQAVQSAEARTHAVSLLHFITNTYPKTPQAHLSRVRLADGFAPLHAETATHATPDPYGRVTPAPSASASGTPAVATPVASATP